MECNKEAAQTAKEIAEKKFLEEDIASAKKFAVKAENLYPKLDGLSQFMATLDLYISAEHKLEGEVDYYKVLNVTPSDDDDIIRKNYRKLALSLHPDKNKSVGVDGDFKILSEAWSVLSDKTRRYSHDQKRLLSFLYRSYHANVLVSAGDQSSHNLSKHKDSNAQTQKSSNPAQHDPSSTGNIFPNISGDYSTPMSIHMQEQASTHNTRNERPHSIGRKRAKNEYVARPIVSGLPAASEAEKNKRRRVEMKKIARAGAVSGSNVKGDELKNKRPNDSKEWKTLKRSQQIKCQVAV